MLNLHILLSKILKISFYFPSILHLYHFYDKLHDIHSNNLHHYESLYAQDEDLYYMLVPQKKASPLVFTIKLEERQDDNSYISFNHAADPSSDQWHRNGKDEFLVYTKYLSFYDDYFAGNSDQYEEIKNLAWEGEVTMINEDSWSSNGRGQECQNEPRL